MENRAHALVAGLFIVLLGSVLVGALLWFRGDHRDRIEHVVVARTGVPGLSLKAAVKLRGVEVGSVEAIDFDPADAQQILIRVAVDAAAPLTRGTFAQLGYQGVTGLSFIEFGDNGTDPRPLREGSPPERRIALQPSLLDQLSASGPALLAGFSETAQRLNTLLDAGNQQRVGRVLDSAERSLVLFGDGARQLQPTLAALPQLMQGLTQRVDQLAARADASLQRADAATEAAVRLADDVRGRLGVLDSAGAAALGVQRAARSLELGLTGPDAGVTPPLLPLLTQTARTADRALNQLGDEPHSLLFGRGPVRAGPGEAGFDSGAAR